MIEDNISSQIQIGIIGVGQIGKYHIEKYQKLPGAKVIAICGRQEAKTREVASMYKIPHYYTDYKELLARDDIQAIDICLHNNLHRDATEMALRAGKDVFCEKPIAGSYIDAVGMVNTAYECNHRLSVQLDTLFTIETKAAKLLIDDGKLGHIYYAASNGLRRRGRPFVDGYGTADFVKKEFSGGGALYDMGIYHIAQVLYLLGNPKPERVSGQLYQQTPINPSRYTLSGYNVEELGLGFVHLEGGITMNVFEAWAIHLEQIQGSFIAGSLGGILLKPFGFYQNIGDLELNCLTNLDSLQFRLQNLYDFGNAYDGPQEHWIAALQNRVKLLPTAEIALNSSMIVEGIALSNELGREVSAAEIIALSSSNAKTL